MPKKQSEVDAEGAELSRSAKQVQSAIWLIGLAILAWQGWWWPGILVLVAISGLTEAAMRQVVSRRAEALASRQRADELDQARTALVPGVCPSCGSPLTPEAVVWTSSRTATCPYCKRVVTDVQN